MMNIFLKNLGLFSFWMMPLICGCVVRKKTHGYVSERIQKIVKGKTSKDTVLQDVGDPIVFASDPQVFHYVQSGVKISSLRRPEIESIYFYTITFDDKNIVKDIDRSVKMPWDAQKNISQKVRKPSSS